ncbi:hypothetical protein Val02_15370 [Virgisporangium aliadipatigenens]|uniref:histidine kinase n=2 Tax=Virgisporangium aliadipatigenens TaxID=741659 RepID=A0A8J4DP90_9ACTN|nr:hypothetical protein Val02_15370 [Virgisporangium aliadipatigenens]
MGQTLRGVLRSVGRGLTGADPLPEVLDAVAEGVFVARPDGRVVLCNAAAVRLLGLRGVPRDLRDLPLREFRTVEGLALVPRELPIAHAARGRRAAADLRLPDDRVLRMDARPLRRRVVAVLREVTLDDVLAVERHQLERLKSDLIATVSHELRTPLTSIQGYTELLLGGDAGGLDAMQRRMVDAIGNNGARLLTLVDDLLAFARVDAGEFTPSAEPVHLPDVLERVDSAIRPGLPEGLRLVRDVPADVPLVTGDPVQLERALRNLVGNAVKFSPGGGTVLLACARDGAEVRVSVADTGMGIPEDEQARLFERFFRASQARERHLPGAGLGLALVKTIAEGHSGRVSLISAPDAGTTVTLHLPVRNA